MTYDNLPIMNSFQIEFKPLGMDLNNFEFTKSFNFGESIFPSANITPYTFNTTNFLGSIFNNSFNFGFNLTNSINIYGFNNNLTPKISLTSSTNKNQKTYNNTASAVNTSTWNNFVKTYGVTEKTINGSKVYACRWSSFSKSQSEWLGMQQYMLEAAEELGLTLVYSDMDRSVSASNAARKKKGNIVAEGGKSPHNYGTACDICLFKDGVAVSAKSALFRQFAELAKQKSGNRIAWGGDWRKKNEEHHFELRDWKKYQTDQYKIV